MKVNPDLITVVRRDERQTVEQILEAKQAKRQTVEQILAAKEAEKEAAERQKQGLINSVTSGIRNEDYKKKVETYLNKNTEKKLTAEIKPKTAESIISKYLNESSADTKKRAMAKLNKPIELKIDSYNPNELKTQKKSDDFTALLSDKADRSQKKNIGLAAILNAEAEKIREAGKMKNEAYNNVKEAQREIEIGKLVRRVASNDRDDNFLGQFTANYNQGLLSQKKAKAYSRYIRDVGTAENENHYDKIYADALDKLIGELQFKDEAALDDENAVLPLITKDLAQYLPQLIDQTKAKAKGGLTGYAAGQVTGLPKPLMKAGYVIGSGIDSFNTTQGYTYDRLRKLGIPHDEAVKASKDEAILSSIVEMGDSGVDIATMSGLLDLLNIPAKTVKKKAAKSGLKKLLKGLAKYGVNILSEAAEEGLQEKIAIENDKRMTGEDGSLWNFLNPMSYINDTPENKERVLESAAGGARLAAIMFPVQAGVNTLLTRNADTSSTSNIEGNISSLSNMPESVMNFGDTLGERGRRFLYARYNDNSFDTSNFDTYRESFSRFYNSGRSGLDFDKMYKTADAEFKSAMPFPYAKIVYDLGEADKADAVKGSTARGVTLENNALENNALESNTKESNTGSLVFNENKAGLIDNEYAKEADPDTANLINKSSKQLGVVTRYAEDGSVMNGLANASYSDGKIKLEQGSELRHYVHEVGHRIKETSPDDYRSVADYIFKGFEAEGKDVLERYRSIYDEKGIEISDADLREEIVNDEIGNIISTPSKLNSLIENAQKGLLDESKTISENLNILQRFKEAVKAFVERIKQAFKSGKISKNYADESIRSAQRAEELIQAAYNSSVKFTEAEREKMQSEQARTQAEVKQGETAEAYKQEGTAAEKYSIKETPEGTRYVQADRENAYNEVLDDEPKRWKGNIKRYINDEIRHGEDTVVTGADGDELTLTKDTAGKAGYRNEVTKKGGQKRHMNNTEYARKLRAETHIDEVAQASKRGKKDVPDRKDHEFAQDGFNYRDAYFKDIDDKDYKLTVSVGKNNGVNTVYNIGKMEKTDKIKGEAPIVRALSTTSGETVDNTDNKTSVRVNLSENKIPQKGENVNTQSEKISKNFSEESSEASENAENIRTAASKEKASLKGVTEALETDEEVKRLRKEVESLNKKLKNARSLITPDMKSVDKFVKELKKEYSSEISDTDLYNYISGLKEKIMSVANGDMTFEELVQYSNGIAKEIISNSIQENNELRENNREMIRHIKETKFHVDEETVSEFGDDWKGFRQRNQLRIGFTTKQSGNMDMDVLYRELEWNYPEFFNSRKEKSGKERLLHMEKVLDSLRPVYENRYAGYIDEASEWLGASIIERIYQPETLRKNNLKAKDGKINIAYDTATIHNEANRVIRKIIRNQKKWEEEQIQSIEEKYRSRVEKWSERMKKADTAKSIRFHFSRLEKGLNNPMPNRRLSIPDGLRQPVSDFLKAFNIKEDRISDDVVESIGNLEAYFLSQAEKEHGFYAESGADFGAFDTALDAVADEIAKELYSVKKALAEAKAKADGVTDGVTKAKAKPEVRRMSIMPLDELKALNRAAQLIENGIRSLNVIRINKREHWISDLAKGVTDDWKTIKKGKPHKKISVFSSGDGIMQNIANVVNVDMLDPGTASHILGESFEDVYQNVLKSGRKKEVEAMSFSMKTAENIRKACDIVTLENKRKSLKLAGEDIRLSNAEIINLYMLARQPQSKKHLESGGFVIRDFKEGIHKYDKRIKALGESDFEIINNAMTDEMKKVVAELDDYFAKARDMLNEESKRTDGFSRFPEMKLYCPITTDSDYSATKQGIPQKQKRAAKPENMSYAKTREKDVSSPVVVKSILNVYDSYAAFLAKYCGYKGALRDFSALLNYKEGGADGLSLRGSMRESFGSNMVKYWDKLLGDIAGSGSISKDATEGIFSKLVSNAKAATIGFKLSVAVQQPTSYFRAGVVLSPQHLFNPAVLKPANKDLIYKYSEITQIKDWGFNGMFEGPQVHGLLWDEGSVSGAERLNPLRHPIKKSLIGELKEGQMWLFGQLDSITWRRLWNACELEVRSEYKKQFGSEYKNKIKSEQNAFYTAVGKKMDEVIDQTQVVDNTFSQSQIQRSDSGITKLVTPFFSEPTKTYNCYYRAFSDFARTKNVKKFGQSIVALFSSMVAANFAKAVIQTGSGDEYDEYITEKLFDAIAEKINGSGEEEKSEATENEKTLKYHSRKERIFWATADGVLQDKFNILPFARDIFSMLEGFDVNRMDMEVISETINTMSRLTDKKYSSGEKTLQAIGLMGQLCGIGVNGLRKNIENNMIKLFNGHKKDFWVEYKILKFTRADITNQDNLTELAKILYRAYRANQSEQYQMIKDDIIKSGVSAEKLNKKMEALLKASKKYNDDFSSFDTVFDYVGELEDVEKEADDDYTIDSLLAEKAPDEKLRIYNEYTSLLKEKENNISDALKKRNVSDDFIRNKLIEKTRKYAKEIALRDTSGGEYVISKDGESWIESAEKAPVALGISTADYIYYSTVYERSTQTMDSAAMKKAVKSGIKVEDYLKFKQAIKQAEDKLSEAREKAKEKGIKLKLNKNEKYKFYKEHLDETDLSEKTVNKILYFYTYVKDKD